MSPKRPKLLSSKGKTPVRDQVAHDAAAAAHQVVPEAAEEAAELEGEDGGAHQAAAHQVVQAAVHQVVRPHQVVPVSAIFPL